MLPLKIGLRLSSLQLPFQKALLTAARLGVEGVEIEAKNELSAGNLTRSGIRHVRKLLDDANVRVAAVSFLTRHGYDVVDQLDRRVQATKSTMQLAYDLGSHVVINRVGTLPDPDSPARHAFLDVLTDLGHHGQHVGAMLCTTTGSESAEELQKLLQALPEGSLGVDFDPAALLINEHNPADALTLLRNSIYHFRGTDATRDVARRTGELTPPGTGSCELPVLLAMLQSYEYAGFVTFEQHEATGGSAGLMHTRQFFERLKLS